MPDFQVINLGAVANDGTGTKLRPGGAMINENFQLIKDLVFSPSGALSAPSVAGLSALAGSLEDQQPVHVLGYSAAGDGGGQNLIYHATGRGGVTIDGGWYFAGPGADDYYEAEDKTVAHSLRFGMDPTGTADSRARMQAMVDSAIAVGTPKPPCYLAPGEYRIDATVFINASITLFGAGSGHAFTEGKSVLRSTISDGSPTVYITQSTQGMSLHDFTIQGAGNTQATTGLQAGDGITNFVSRALLSNVSVHHCDVGVNWNGWIVDMSHLFVTYCGLGARFFETNGCRLQVRAENCGISLHIEKVTGTSISAMLEGVEETGSSYYPMTKLLVVKECRGLFFDAFYAECSADSLTHLIHLGTTSGVTAEQVTFDNALMIFLTGLNPSNPIVIDNARNVKFDNCFVNNFVGTEPLVKITSLARDVHVDIQSLSRIFIQEDTVSGGNSPTRGLRQYLMDPQFDHFLDVSNYSAEATTGFTRSQESLEATPNVRTGFEAVRLTTTGALTDHYAGFSEGVSDFLARLRGRRFTLGAWIYPINYDFANIRLKLRANANGAKLVDSDEPPNWIEIHTSDKWLWIPCRGTFPTSLTSFSWAVVLEDGTSLGTEEFIVDSAGLVDSWVSYEQFISAPAFREVMTFLHPGAVPTSAPSIPGGLWNDGGVLSIS